MTALKNNVPATMRKPLENAGVILPVLISTHYDGDLNEAIEFIAGALNHQERVNAKKEDGKTDAPTFSVIIDKVEIIERKANGSLLGKKAKIHYHDAKDRDGKEENIDTGWTEYYGTDAREYSAWQTSLSNTLLDIAEANIGKECFMTKAYIKGVETQYNKDGKVKFLANLEPAASGKGASSGGRGGASERKNDSGSSRRSKSEVTVDDFIKAIEDVRGVTDAQIDAAIDNNKLLRSVIASINLGGDKVADDVCDSVEAIVGDAFTRKIEDEFFDKYEKSNNIVDASAWLVAATAAE